MLGDLQRRREHTFTFSHYWSTDIKIPKKILSHYLQAFLVLSLRLLYKYGCHMCAILGAYLYLKYIHCFCETGRQHGWVLCLFRACFWFIDGSLFAVTSPDRCVQGAFSGHFYKIDPRSSYTQWLGVRLEGFKDHQIHIICVSWSNCLTILPHFLVYTFGITKLSNNILFKY